MIYNNKVYMPPVSDWLLLGPENDALIQISGEQDNDNEGWGNGGSMDWTDD